MTTLCFEGPNGVGKSTQVERAREELRRVVGVESEAYRDPGVAPGHPCMKLRELFIYGEQWADSRVSLLVGSAARCELTCAVRSFLRKNPQHAMFLDRYEMSTYAYQSLMLEHDNGMTRTEAFAHLHMLHGLIDCVVPDVVFFFDLAPEIAFPRRLSGEARRKTDANRDDQFEARGLEFARRLQDRYLYVVDRWAAGDPQFRWLGKDVVTVRVEADASPEDVFQLYRPRLMSLFPEKAERNTARD